MEYVVTLSVHGVKVPVDGAVDKLVDLLAPQSGGVIGGGPGEDRWSVSVAVDATGIDLALAKGMAYVAAAASTAHMPLSNIDGLEVLSVDEEQRRIDLRMADMRATHDATSR